MKVPITAEAAANTVARQLATSITTSVSNAAKAIKEGGKFQNVGPMAGAPALTGDQIKAALGTELVELIEKIDALVNPPAPVVPAEVAPIPAPAQ